MCMDSTIMIFCTIYFCFISKSSYYWELYALLANFTSVFLVILLAPESPKFLYEKKLFQKARNNLIYLAQNNSVEPEKYAPINFDQSSYVPLEDYEGDCDGEPKPESEAISTTGETALIV